MLTYCPCTIDDAMYIADTLREADQDEITTLTQLPPYAVAIESFFNTQDTCQAVLADENPVAMYGVATGGWVWMLVSKDIEPYRLEFARYCRPVVEKLNEQHPHLHNIADSRNSLHLRWLEWCGFTIDYEGYIPINGVPFFPFERIHKPCA